MYSSLYLQNTRVGMFRMGTDPPPERRSTISSMLPCTYQNTRMRNLSGGSNGSTASGSSSDSSLQLDNQLNFLMDITLSANNLPSEAMSSSSTVPASRDSTSPHRKLDRSWSDNDNDKNGSQRSVNSSRYKTELCRPFEESGSCKYGDKCQFAHGYHELRNLARHPKYKTELCRTFHTVGFCPYGPRCHFVHEDETKPATSSPKPGRDSSMHSNSGSSSPSLSPSGSDFNIFSYPSENNSRSTSGKIDNRQFNALTVNIDYSKNIYNLQDLDKRFSGMKLDHKYSNDNSNIFSANEPRLIGSEERDIFSEVTMFNSEEVMLDNAPRASSTATSQSIKLDNFSYMDSQPTYWQPYDNYYSTVIKSVDSSHNSPCSNGSNSNSSNHGGSTESLSNSTFANWRSQVAIGHY
uniref:C3H1-type domain-containing protein n=1 Tax=Arion vulgaris TaxID=1028688 RepID=A0A0B7B7D2_9EUPU